MCAAVYRQRHLVNATGVTAGPAESNGKLLLGIWRDSLHVTCGLTACTPGSAPGPTPGNEYGKTLPFLDLYATRSCNMGRHTPKTPVSRPLVSVNVASCRSQCEHSEDRPDAEQRRFHAGDGVRAGTGSTNRGQAPEFNRTLNTLCIIDSRQNQ